MNIKVAAMAVVFGLGMTEAMAQPGYYQDAPVYRQGSREVPPMQVDRIVRRAGFTPVARPALRGPNYVVQAVDRNGDLARVVIDAESGALLAVRALARSGVRDRMAAVYPEGGTQWHGPRPRANVPGAGSRTAALPVTPLPRPRPATAPAVVKPDVGAPAVTQPAAVTPPTESPEVPKPTPNEAAPSTPAPETTDDGSPSSPRVILPGGPPAKHERAAEANETPATEAAPAAQPAKPSPYNIPPAQGLE